MIGRLGRREFARLALGGLAGMAAASVGVAQTKRRPNIVFIFTDDQRFDAIGCAGRLPIMTPTADSLAARGTRFDRAYVTLSICSPSRAATLTGRYGSANGVTTLGKPIADGEKTFAHYLKKAGYQTAHVGKWHLKTTPQEAGFGFVQYFMSNGPYFGRNVFEDGKQRKVPGFIDDWVADQSIRFIDEAVKQPEPFLLWMCTQVPHMNHKHDWNAKDETLARYDPDKMPLPETWGDDLAGKPPYLKDNRHRKQALGYGYDKPDGVRRHWQRYCAAVTQVDASIGRMVQHIDDIGLSDETWFLFMGDNGWFMGEHGFTSKVLAYEESMRVPMIVAGPGTKPRVDKRFVLNIDLFSTVLDIAGVARPENAHGKSLLPLIEEKKFDWRDGVFYEAPTPVLGSRPLLAFRTEEWKYIETHETPDCGNVVFRELYDMRNDPEETTNLADDPGHKGTLRMMARRLREGRNSVQETE